MSDFDDEFDEFEDALAEELAASPEELRRMELQRRRALLNAPGWSGRQERRKVEVGVQRLRRLLDTSHWVQGRITRLIYAVGNGDCAWEEISPNEPVSQRKCLELGCELARRIEENRTLYERARLCVEDEELRQLLELLSQQRDELGLQLGSVALHWSFYVEWLNEIQEDLLTMRGSRFGEQRRHLLEDKHAEVLNPDSFCPVEKGGFTLEIHRRQEALRNALRGTWSFERFKRIRTWARYAAPALDVNRPIPRTKPVPLSEGESPWRLSDD